MRALRILALLWALAGVLWSGCAVLTRGGIRVTVRNDSPQDIDCQIRVWRHSVERYVGHGYHVVEYLHPEGDAQPVTVTLRAGDVVTHHDSGAYFDLGDHGDVDFVIRADGSVASTVSKRYSTFGLLPAPTRECEAWQLLAYLLPIVLLGLAGGGVQRRLAPSATSTVSAP